VIAAAITGKEPCADGGFGLVYKAAIDGEEVAIKIPTDQGMLLCHAFLLKLVYTPAYACCIPCVWSSRSQTVQDIYMSMNM
jgi:hypothetical protein